MAFSVFIQLFGNNKIRLHPRNFPLAVFTNQDKAVEILREKGLATAAKKASRVAAEGVIGLFSNGDASALVELNCETDFVGKNPEFIALANQIAKTVVENKPADLDALLATTISDG